MKKHAMAVVAAILVVALSGCTCCEVCGGKCQDKDKKACGQTCPKPTK